MGYDIVIPIGVFAVAAVIGAAWRSWWALSVPCTAAVIFSLIVAHTNRGTETNLETAFGIVFLFLFPIAATGTTAGIISGRRFTAGS